MALERTIQGSICELGYADAFRSSAECGDVLQSWLHDRNTVRPRSALAKKSGYARLKRNNPVGGDTR